MNDQVNKKYIDLKNYSSKNLKINFSYESLDISKLEALAYIFTLSGYKIIDVECNSDKLKAINDGIKKGLTKNNKSHYSTKTKPLISVSFDISKISFPEIISQIDKLNIKNMEFDIIEFHCFDLAPEYIDNFISNLKNLKNGYIFSLSISRDKFSNSSIVQLIKSFHQNISKNLLVEIENISSKEEDNSLSAILQVLSTADIINKDLKNSEFIFKRMPLFLPNDLNFNTANLAEQCNVEFNGLNIDLAIFPKLIKNIDEINKISEEDLINLLNSIKKKSDLKLTSDN
tara:strand:- start:15718 stop:16578 length:861 start_codon:yes stop_codon:yes gene_type:complete